jgi:hypothetical protein
MESVWFRSGGQLYQDTDASSLLCSTSCSVALCVEILISCVTASAMTRRPSKKTPLAVGVGHKQQQVK